MLQLKRNAGMTVKEYAAEQEEEEQLKEFKELAKKVRGGLTSMHRIASHRTLIAALDCRAAPRGSQPPLLMDRAHFGQWFAPKPSNLH